MKKLFITVAAMSMVLVGCGGKGSAKKADWSNEDKALMQEYLHGEVLPYAKGMGEISVQYDDEDETLLFLGSKNISYDTLYDYLDVYDQSDDWHAVQSLYLGMYTFEKVVTVEEEIRYVTVSAGLYEDEKNDKEVFCMLASDPYVYEYPTEYVAGLVDYIFGSEILPPAIAAEKYLLNENGISCYGVANTIVTDYISSFAELAFDVFPEEIVDEFGYRIIVAKDKSYSVTFKYFEDDSSLDIYFDGAYVQAWTDVDLLATSIFTKYSEYGASYFLIPTVINTGLLRVKDNPDNEFFASMDYADFMSFTIDVINVELEVFTNYLTQLEGSQWNISVEDDEYYCFATKDNHEIEVEYDDDYKVITITVWLVAAEESEGE